MNSRRRLIVAIGAGTFGMFSMTAFAQTQRVYRVGILVPTGVAITNSPYYVAFLDELRRLGYVEGQNVSIIARYAGGHLEGLPSAAAELVSERVDVILAGTTPAAQAARQATAAIPIVFSILSDPVGSGVVQTLARPGFNVTGTSSRSNELAAKRMEILKDMFPKVSRVAVLSTDERHVLPHVEEVKRAAKLLGIDTLTTQVLRREDMEVAAKQLRAWHADAIAVVDTIANFTNRELLVEFAAKVQLPAMYPQAIYVGVGGLVSYAPSYELLFRRAAHYVDKILKGANPAEMPVELPTIFELIINMKTAKELRIKIPQPILLRADKVIE